MIDEAPCCDPVTDVALSADEATVLASVFKALADPVRLRLLSMVASAPDGGVCACDLTDPLSRSQATVSHHLSVLAGAGFIVREQRGKWAWFSLADRQRGFVRSVLEGSPAIGTPVTVGEIHGALGP